MKFEYLPKEILTNNNLTPAEKVTYFHLFHISGWNEEKVLNRTNLANKLGITTKTIQRTLTKLEFLKLITLSKDNTFTVYLNRIEITDREFFKEEYAMKMLGDFIKVPTQFLYDTNLTPAERLAVMMLFDFYFNIDNKGFFKQKKKDVVLKSVSAYYNIDERSFRGHIESIKAKGAIDYTVHSSKGKSKIYGFKFFKQETIKVYNNGKTIISANGSKVITNEQVIEPEHKLEDAIEEMTNDEVEETIHKCDTYANTNKILRNMPEGKYNYFIAKLAGRTDLTITLRRFV